MDRWRRRGCRPDMRWRAEQWDVDFPGLIPDSPVVYQPIPVEGAALLAVIRRRGGVTVERS